MRELPTMADRARYDRIGAERDDGDDRDLLFPKLRVRRAEPCEAAFQLFAMPSAVITLRDDVVLLPDTEFRAGIQTRAGTAFGPFSAVRFLL